MVFAQKVLEGVLPTIDVFASSTTTKVPGSFYIIIYISSTWIWGQRMPSASHGLTYSPVWHFAYINPPFRRMGEVLRKIADRVDCISVAPQRPRHWVATLHKMPVKLSVVLPQWDDLCIPSRYVSHQKRKQLQHPKYQMVAVVVLQGLERK